MRINQTRKVRQALEVDLDMNAENGAIFLSATEDGREVIGFSLSPAQAENLVVEIASWLGVLRVRRVVRRLKAWVEDAARRGEE